ncbi:MAG TPA: amidohydrolase family protein [Pyrinomonadaceae bacterium]|nr:amidohydrolase family protein [Pyrinomonadaceae bacterium]
MRHTTSRLLSAVTLALGLFAAWLVAWPAGVGAQLSTAGPGAYAITNARVVTVSGPVIERGTVVVRDGLIAAVGPNVQVPPDARIIDGTGLTVYPGLIDASSTLAVPRPTPGATPASTSGLAALFGQTAATAVSPNSTRLPGLQPEVRAADVIRPGGSEVEAARSAGLTAAQTAPRGNVFLGQSAVIQLSGETPQQMILRSPAALHVGLAPIGGGQFPGSLMGVYAALRQMLLDAQQYREALAAYERSPRGQRRPGQDKSLEALLPVLARQMTFVMQADREREIARALDLAQEFNLQLVIAGGREADQIAQRLKAQNVPVLLSLNFPRRATAASPDAEPETLRTLRERAEAPKTAGRLAAAGVRFAFQSGGMTNFSEFLSNASAAVAEGLSREEALRAMTLRSAELLGVAQQLGSVEVGKIANLTVTRGDIFDRGRQIAHVFIDGRPVELRPAAPAGAGQGLSGAWVLRLNLGGMTGEQSEYTVTLNLQQQGDRLTGSLEGQLGSGQIAAGNTAGNEIEFTVPVTLPGPAGQTTDAIFKGTVAGNEMSGTVQIVGRGPGTFTGTRPGGGGGRPEGGTRPDGAPARGPAAAPPGAEAGGVGGTYRVELNLGPRTLPATLTLRQEGERLTGTMTSEFGTSEITSGTATGNQFRFSTTVTVGQTLSLVVSGAVEGSRISGTVNTATGNATFSGTRVP